MTKTQIKKLDAMPDGTYCTVAITHKGRCLARLDTAVIRKRVEAPVGFAWCIEDVVPVRAKVYLCPDYKLMILENNHFRIDI
jgi:hypothetical protein